MNIHGHSAGTPDHHFLPRYSEFSVKDEGWVGCTSHALQSRTFSLSVAAAISFYIKNMFRCKLHSKTLGLKQTMAYFFT